MKFIIVVSVSKKILLIVFQYLTISLFKHPILNGRISTCDQAHFHFHIVVSFILGPNMYDYSDNMLVFVVYFFKVSLIYMLVDKMLMDNTFSHLYCVLMLIN